MKCLDTTYLIDFLSGDPDAIRFASNYDMKSPLVTTELNVFEVLVGIEMVQVGKRKREQWKAKAEGLFNRLDVFTLERKGSIKAAEINGELTRKGVTIDAMDTLVAGISLSNACNEVVTRNIKHFSKIKDMKVIEY